MTTKKILFIIFTVLILAGAAVGVAYSVLPDTTEIVTDSVELIVDTIPTDSLL